MRHFSLASLSGWQLERFACRVPEGELHKVQNKLHLEVCLHQLMKMGDQTVGEFLAALRHLGIRITVDGDRLNCNAPKNVLTPELKAELLRRKPELLQFLHAAVLNGSPDPKIGNIADRSELPLSSGQQRLWFLDQFQPGNSAYNISFALELNGLLDCPALESSLREIVRRHEVLRCRLVNVDGMPKAYPVAASEWTLHRSDFRSVEPSNRREWTNQFAKEHAQQPFDLAAGLLFRATLLEFDDLHHVLLLVLHHSAADGWSIGLLVRELGLLYPAFRENQPSPLPELSLQYSDFAHWQNQTLQSDSMRSQMNYWRKQLHAPLSATELPADRPRPLQPAFLGARRRFTLGKELLESVHRLSLAEHTTTFMVLVSAFKLLPLHRPGRYFDRLAAAGRSRPELEDLIGLFINNLALRTSLAGDPTVRQLIGRVRETSLNAFAHQDIPFDQIVTALQPDRDLSRAPFFQVMFILQNFPMRPFSLPALTVRPLYFDAGTSRFDLTVEASENDEGSLDLYFEYNTELFEAATIEQLARHYENLVAAMAAYPEQCISDLPMFSSDELREPHVANGRTRAEYPSRQLHPRVVREPGCQDAR